MIFIPVKIKWKSLGGFTWIGCWKVKIRLFNKIKFKIFIQWVDQPVIHEMTWNPDQSKKGRFWTGFQKNFLRHKQTKDDSCKDTAIYIGSQIYKGFLLIIDYLYLRLDDLRFTIEYFDLRFTINWFYESICNRQSKLVNLF